MNQVSPIIIWSKRSRAWFDNIFNRRFWCRWKIIFHSLKYSIDGLCLTLMFWVLKMTAIQSVHWLMIMYIYIYNEDIFCLKNFDTFTRTFVHVSKVNAVALAQLIFQILHLLKQNIYTDRTSINNNGLANVWPWWLKWLEHSAWIWRCGDGIPLRSRHVLSQKHLHFHKNIHSNSDFTSNMHMYINYTPFGVMVTFNFSKYFFLP